jgi:hypothetical protein
MTSIGSRLYTVCLCILFIGGCAYASGSAIVAGTKRAPTDPTLVKLYLEPPSDFEVIGVVDASGNGWTAQESQDLAIAELKKQAAKLGANGVLLMLSGETTSTAVGGYNAGYFYAIPVTAKTVSGKAIYIKQ